MPLYERQFLSIVEGSCSRWPRSSASHEENDSFYFSSPQEQNEIMEMFCNDILWNLANDIRIQHFFAIIVDGTQDITDAEQEPICISYVYEDLNVTEMFVGLYSVPETTGVQCSDKTQSPNISVESLNLRWRSKHKWCLQGVPGKSHRTTTICHSFTLWCTSS